MTTLPIGAAVLDPAAAVLRGPGGDAPLPTQAVRLLACLAAREGETVGTLDLVSALYDGGFPPTRDAARIVQNRTVAVRRALRDAGAGMVLHTVLGVGLRLETDPNAIRRAA